MIFMYALKYLDLEVGIDDIMSKVCTPDTNKNIIIIRDPKPVGRIPVDDTWYEYMYVGTIIVVVGVYQVQGKVPQKKLPGSCFCCQHTE